jgi:hypothetical protein
LYVSWSSSSPVCCHFRRSCWTSVHIALQSSLNPAIDRGDGLDHGVDASMPALRALTIVVACLSICSLSLRSMSFGIWRSMSSTVSRSFERSVFVHIRFFILGANFQFHSTVTSIGKWSESLSRRESTLQYVTRDATSSVAKVRSIVDVPVCPLRVMVPGTVSSWSWWSSMIVMRG